MSPQHLFSDHVRFLDQIDRLHAKYEERALLYDTMQDGVSFASLSMNRTQVGVAAVRRGLPHGIEHATQLSA